MRTFLRRPSALPFARPSFRPTLVTAALLLGTVLAVASCRRTDGSSPGLAPSSASAAGPTPGASAPSAPDAGPMLEVGGRVELVVLHTSDLHTNLLPYDYFRGEADEGRGLAKVASVVARERAAHPCSLLVDTGDAIQGTPIGSQYARTDVPEHPMAVAMNALRYDAMALGNHELNFGLGVLRKFVDGATFPVLAANARRTKDGSAAFPPYAVREVCGVKVAILGLVTPAIPRWERPENYAGLMFRGLVETAKDYVPRLRQEGADVVVVAVHAGPESDEGTACEAPAATRADGGTKEPEGSRRFAADDPGENAVVALAREVPGIDAILTGHTHRVIQGKCVGGAVYEQPGRFGSHVGEVTVVVEKDAKGTHVADKWARAIAVQDAPIDERLRTLVMPFHDAVMRAIEAPVGSAVAPFEGGLPARFSDSALADLVNAAQEEAARRAGFPVDASMAPVFTVGGRLPAGPVRLRDVFGVYPFDNTLYVLEVRGATLRRLLEKEATYFRTLQPSALPPTPEACRTAIPDYNWDLFSGIDYTIDATRPEGQRVVTLRLRGKDLQGDDVVRLAANNYRGGGGGGFEMLKEAKLLWASADGVREMLVDYVKTHPGLDPARIGACNFRLVPDLYGAYFAKSLGPARCASVRGESGR